MRYRVFIALLFGTRIALSASGDIRLNQLGYYPESVKIFVVVESDSTEFAVKDPNGVVKYRGALVERGVWRDSGEHVRTGDFSNLRQPGSYVITVPDKGESYPFKVCPNLYRDVLTAAMRSYYYQRASTPLEEKFAGKYARAMGHPDDECIYHSSSGKSDGRRSFPKGWYDAGDYNKYVVNAGVTVGTLLGLAEVFPQAFPDRSLNIPESGNGISDLLDEIRYELDWLQTMQDDDGGVFFKLTTKGFPGFVMPSEDKAPRYVVGKSTTAALNFAAVMAQASRVFKGTDKVAASRFLIGAENAWNWARVNDHVVYTNPPDVQSGAYSHTRFENEFFWAAAELLISTGKDEYLQYVRKTLKPSVMELTENWRNFVRNLGELSLANVPSRLTEQEQTNIRDSIIALADQLCDKAQAIPYRVPLDRFAWGSNSDILDQGIILASAYRHTRNRKYLDSLVEDIDYIFGKNATGYSFVTGFGENSPMHPHHRPSEADNVPGPIPGFVVGGPNSDRQDDRSKTPSGIVYANHLPAKSYTDQSGSYASNEVAINWNAPLVYTLVFIQENMPKVPRKN